MVDAHRIGDLAWGLDWSDPLKGRELFREFGARWITEHRVGERTREEYLSLWRHHIEP